MVSTLASFPPCVSIPNMNLPIISGVRVPLIILPSHNAHPVGVSVPFQITIVPLGNKLKLPLTDKSQGTVKPFFHFVI